MQVPGFDGSDSEADADDLAAGFHQVEFCGKSWRRRFFDYDYDRFGPSQSIMIAWNRVSPSESLTFSRFSMRFWPRSNHRLLAAAATPFSSASAVTMSTISLA